MTSLPDGVKCVKPCVKKYMTFKQGKTMLTLCVQLSTVCFYTIFSFLPLTELNVVKL